MRCCESDGANRECWSARVCRCFGGGIVRAIPARLRLARRSPKGEGGCCRRHHDQEVRFGLRRRAAGKRRVPQCTPANDRKAGYARNPIEIGIAIGIEVDFDTDFDFDFETYTRNRVS